MAGIIGRKQKSKMDEADESMTAMPTSKQDEIPREHKPSTQDGEGEQATEEEEAAMSSLLNAAMAAIYSDQSHSKIMDTLKQGSRPDQALADVAVAIVMQLDQQSGGKVPETVILPGTMAILAMLAEVAQASGLFEADEQTLLAAGQQATLSLLREYGVNPQDVQALAQQLGPEQVKSLIAQQQQSAQGWAGGAQAQPQQPAQQPPQQPPQAG